MSRIFKCFIKIIHSFDIYIRHVFVVFSGTTISVLIPIIAVPILTRFYTPEDFGQYGFVYSLGLFLAVFCTLRYEHSIVIAESDREAQQAQRLCECLIFGIILFILIIMVGLQIGHTIFHFGEWWYAWYFTIPLIAVSTAVFRIQTLLANRRECFKLVSKVKIIQGLSITILSIFFGVVGPLPHGMVWAFILGNTVGTILLQQKNKNNLSIQKKDLFKIAKRYSNFPRFSLPADLISAAVAYPLIIFPLLFGNEIAGFLTLAYRIMAIPSRLISTAVSEVFFQQASKKLREKNQCRHLFLFTTAFLTVIGIIGFGILFFSCDFIFSVFFEPQWEATSTYIKILIPLFICNFIVSPLSTMIYIAEKQTWNLYWQTFYLFMSTVSMMGTWTLYGNLELSLLSFVFSGIISYIVYFILLFILTKKREENHLDAQEVYL